MGFSPCGFSTYLIRKNTMAVINVVRTTIQEFVLNLFVIPICAIPSTANMRCSTRPYSMLSPGREVRDRRRTQGVRCSEGVSDSHGPGKSKRQHWDVAVLSREHVEKGNAKGDYDVLPLLAAVEFGLNEAESHLCDDMDRLTHGGANASILSSCTSTACLRLDTRSLAVIGRLILRR